MRRAILAILLTAMAGSALAAETFAIKAFEVEGATLVPVEVLQRDLSPLTGDSRSFSDLQRAREIIAAAYARRGYSAVEVNLPPQDVTAGTVKLVVTELRIARVKVSGGKYFDERNVLATLPHLRSGEPINATALRDDLAQANRHEAKQARVRFAPSETIPGGVDAVVQVEDRSPQGFALVNDNTGSKQAGRLRTGVSYRNSNLFNSDHVLNLQYSTAPERFDETKIFGLSYRVPVYGYGQTLDLTLGYSDVDSGDVGGIFTVSGRGKTAGLRYSIDLPRLGAMQQQVSLGADWREFENSVQFLGGGPSLVPNVTLHPVTLGYTGAVSGSGGDSSFNLAYSRNLPGGADGDAAAINRNRAGGEDEYNILRYGFSHAYPLSKQMDLRFAFDGQYTPDLLVSGEQFGVGGAGSVRGFDARGLSDDEGQHISLEWYLPGWQPSVLQGLQLRPLMFTDFGWVQRNDPTVLERPNASISSGGVGLRAEYRRHAALSLDYGVVIDSAGLQDRGSGFLHANLQIRF